MMKLMVPLLVTVSDGVSQFVVFKFVFAGHQSSRMILFV